jgi:hypothetical protein
VSPTVSFCTEDEVAVAAGVFRLALQNLSDAVKWFFWSIKAVVIVVEELVKKHKRVGWTHERSEVVRVLGVTLIGSLVKIANNFIWGLDNGLSRFVAEVSLDIK